jgi:bla regulator protein blaR1
LLAPKKRAVIQADIDRRVKEQVASPGSEAAARRLIGELRLGTPNYDLMSSEMARETAALTRAGHDSEARCTPVADLTRVGLAGPNIYQASFEKGALEWRIWLNLDGSVDVFLFRAVSPPK